MLEFDIRGNLKDPVCYELSIAELEQYFVRHFTNSNTRQVIYDEFCKLLHKVKVIAGVNFYLLIDGSFISQKDKPDDIDVVFVLPVILWDNEKNLESLKAEFYTFRNRKLKVLDFYFIPDCSESPDHKFYEKAAGMYVYWIDFFTTTKPDEEGNKFSKGIIKIRC